MAAIPRKHGVHSMLNNILFDLVLGLLLGLGGGILGIGGGVIAIPILGLAYGMNQHLAQGTTLVMIVPSVIIGFIRYRQRNEINIRAVLVMCISATVASYFAARFSIGLRSDVLQKAFALFLLVLSIYYVIQLRSKSGADNCSQTIPDSFLPVLGVLSGCMSGVFTVGGGLVVVPALVSLFGYKQTQAQGMALALVVPGSVTTLFAYAQAGNVDWGTGIPLAIGGVLSISYGVALAHKIKASYLKLTFSGVLAGVALMMIAAR